MKKIFKYLLVYPCIKKPKNNNANTIKCFVGGYTNLTTINHTLDFLKIQYSFERGLKFPEMELFCTFVYDHLKYIEKMTYTPYSMCQYKDQLSLKLQNLTILPSNTQTLLKIKLPYKFSFLHNKFKNTIINNVKIVIYKNISLNSDVDFYLQEVYDKLFFIISQFYCIPKFSHGKRKFYNFKHSLGKKIVHKPIKKKILKYQPIKKISEYKLQKYPSPFIPSPPPPPYNLRKRKTTTNKVPNKTTKKDSLKNIY